MYMLISESLKISLMVSYHDNFIEYNFINNILYLNMYHTSILNYLFIYYVSFKYRVITVFYQENQGNKFPRQMVFYAFNAD